MWMSLQTQIDQKMNGRFFVFDPISEHIHHFPNSSNSFNFVPEHAPEYFSRTKNPNISSWN